MSIILNAQNAWAKLASNASNPLGVTEELIQQSLETCPPIDIEGATFLGRFIIPREFVVYDREEQTRDKENDQQSVNEILNDFDQGILLDKPVPIVAFNPERGAVVKGLAGYHRNTVFKTLDQDIYMYDVYDFTKCPDAEYQMEILRNTSNHHRGSFRLQTKHDYLKSTTSAIERKIVDSKWDAIAEFVEKITPEGYGHKSWITKEAATNQQIYSNFRTYSSQRTKNNPNSLNSYLDDAGIAKQGIEHRTIDEIRDQGYIAYCSAEGDGITSWARGITNAMKFGVPVYVFGYAPNRCDLDVFRKQWLEQFQWQKAMMLQFASDVSGDDTFEVNEENFPVKFGGFLPQYVKPNPEDRGRPTEVGFVDEEGNPVIFEAGMDCVSLAFINKQEKREGHKLVA